VGERRQRQCVWQRAHLRRLLGEPGEQNGQPERRRQRLVSSPRAELKRVSRDGREDGSGEGKVGRVGQVRREGGDGVEEAGQLRRPGATDGGCGVDEGDTGERGGRLAVGPLSNAEREDAAKRLTEQVDGPPLLRLDLAGDGLA